MYLIYVWIYIFLNLNLNLNLFFGPEQVDREKQKFVDNVMIETLDALVPYHEKTIDEYRNIRERDVSPIDQWLLVQAGK